MVTHAGRQCQGGVAYMTGGSFTASDCTFSDNQAVCHTGLRVTAFVVSMSLTVSCMSLIAAGVRIGRRGLVCDASRVLRHRGRGVVALDCECGMAACVCMRTCCERVANGVVYVVDCCRRANALTRPFV